MQPWETLQPKNIEHGVESMTDDELAVFIKKKEQELTTQKAKLRNILHTYARENKEISLAKLSEKFPHLELNPEELTDKEVEHNKDALDDTFSDVDKETIAQTTNNPTYTKNLQNVLAGLATMRDKGIQKTQDVFDPVISKFKNNFWKLTLAGGITLSIAGFTKSETGKTMYDYTHSLQHKAQSEYFDTESTPAKLALYVQQAPWSSPDELVSFFERTYDTYQRSKGVGLEEAEPVHVNETAKEKLGAHMDSVLHAHNTAIEDSITQSKEQQEKHRLNEKIDAVMRTLGGPQRFRPVAPHTWVGTRYENNVDGLYARSFVDLSDGLYVTYQPRNSERDKRTVQSDAVLVSDYLYDMDLYDDYQHDHAEKDLDQLRKAVESGNLENQSKFVQVREPVSDKDNVYKTYIKPTAELTTEDFDNNNVYRQSWATLSDLDISPDGEKIKLTNYSKKYHAALFQNQGLPFHEKTGSSHNLRLPGGVGNFGKYQDIDNLDQFGAYLGGTVTVISDDGKIARKITGSVRDVIKTAIAINKETGDEVHFLQSDAGSMNIKALAKNGTLRPNDLDITRNQEPWAGGAEIVIKTQIP